jgi:hypothetical protein
MAQVFLSHMERRIVAVFLAESVESDISGTFATAAKFLRPNAQENAERLREFQDGRSIQLNDESESNAALTAFATKLRRREIQRSGRSFKGG